MGQRGRTRSDEFYAELAFEYEWEVRQGNPRPVKTIALRLGLNAMRVRDMLHAARHRGLLSKNGQGRRAGKLTGYSKGILRNLAGAMKKTEARVPLNESLAA